jgi:hypothetical protein
MIEVGKNKFVSSNIFWCFMLIYYFSFFLASFVAIAIHEPLFGPELSNYLPFFLINKRSVIDFAVVNYYFIMTTLIVIFNLICFINYPYFRKINIKSLEYNFYFFLSLAFWMFGVIGFFFYSKRIGLNVPTAILHASWLPLANISLIILNIENGKNSAIRH